MGDWAGYMVGWLYWYFWVVVVAVGEHGAGYATEAIHYADDLFTDDAIKSGPKIMRHALMKHGDNRTHDHDRIRLVCQQSTQGKLGCFIQSAFFLIAGNRAFGDLKMFAVCHDGGEKNQWLFCEKVPGVRSRRSRERGENTIGMPGDG